MSQNTNIPAFIRTFQRPDTASPGGRVGGMNRGQRNEKPRRLFCDGDIRRVLWRSLSKEFSGDATTVILNEFGCAGVRADVAAVNGRLHGYEIKSDLDTLERIESQVKGYSLIFDNVTAVVATKHVEKLKVKIPGWWGIIAVDCERGRPSLRPVRKGKQNKATSTYEVARLLWRDEALAFLKRLELASGLRRAPAMKIRQCLIDQVPPSQIIAEVRRVLKLRTAFPVVQPRPRNDGSYTTAPTAAVHQKNLDWLLSLQ